MFCYVLIENYLNGCTAYRKIVSVTLNQQESYDWLQAIPLFYPEFINREVQQVPFTGA
jgi:hypothetical protein